MLGMMPKVTPGIARWQKLLPALLAVLAVLLYAGGSGSFRFGGEEDEGSGFGGTGAMPDAMPGSGLGGTGFKPWLGDAGEVRIRRQADAVPIAEQIVEADIPRMAAPQPVQPPPAIVSAPELAARHPAEISITDSIQTRLRHDAVIYQRIVESVEGYYPPEAGPASVRAATPTATPQPAPPAPRQPPEAQSVPAAQHEAPAVSAPAMDTEAATAEAEPAAESWAELIAYLAENRPAPAESEVESEVESMAAAAPTAVQRPQRIRRPELPQVQRGRIVQRPAVLPPRVQPMRF